MRERGKAEREEEERKEKKGEDWSRAAWQIKAKGGKIVEEGKAKGPAQGNTQAGSQQGKGKEKGKDKGKSKQAYYEEDPWQKKTYTWNSSGSSYGGRSSDYRKEPYDRNPNTGYY